METQKCPPIILYLLILYSGASIWGNLTQNNVPLVQEFKENFIVIQNIVAAGPTQMPLNNFWQENSNLSLCTETNLFTVCPQELYVPGYNAPCLLHGNFSICLFFNHDDRGDIFLRNIGSFSMDYKGLYHRIQSSL
jgi:hypothetical protein